VTALPAALPVGGVDLPLPPVERPFYRPDLRGSAVEPFPGQPRKRSLRGFRVIDDAAPAAATGLALTVWWVVHVRRHPWVPCRACKGSGKRRPALLPDRFGTCWWCKGSGRKLRWSARLAGFNRQTGSRR
jgi:hypothetical protein